MAKREMDRELFDLWFNADLSEACSNNVVAHGLHYLQTPGSIETIDIHTLLAALDRGLRALLKHHGHSPHQAMMHGKILTLSTDPYESPEHPEHPPSMFKEAGAK